MPGPYNPIMRTFCRFRTGLLDRIDVDRREIRPGTPLEALLPEPRSRREVWRHLRRQGLRVPPLELSQRDQRRMAWVMLKAVVSWTISLQRWSGLLLAFPLALVAYWVSRGRAVRFPLGLTTVGELVIYMTCFREHKDSGYRWTRNEIELKVRLILAESTGLPLEAVRPESTFAELGIG
jgi:hypothetical protein